MEYNPIIVALDVSSIADAVALVEQVSGNVGAYKVGLELYNAVGPEIFSNIRSADTDARIFYDAKFHDIPNTVAGAVRAVNQHAAWMVNVHASGGGRMMRAAANAAAEAASRPLVIAVTVLTSLDDNDLRQELGLARTASEHVVALARLAQESGCDGVVASPHEIAAVKEACGPGFLVVTPGVRPPGAALGDQKRVMTPGEAIERGADYIVVGRPITGADSPRAAAQSIAEEIAHARSQTAILSNELR